MTQYKNKKRRKAPEWLKPAGLLLGIIAAVIYCGYASVTWECLKPHPYRCLVIDKNVISDHNGDPQYIVAFDCDSLGIRSEELSPQDYYGYRLSETYIRKY